MKIERIVIGIDFSEPAVAAGQWAARVFGAETEIVLVHAIDFPQPPRFLAGRMPPHQELVETASTGATMRLQELRLALPAEDVGVEIRVGRPAEQIVCVAQEVHADLIMVGEHGRRRGIWNVLGSTAERLVHSSPVPVFIARNLPERRPRVILAPIVDSPASARALEWAATLRTLFDAEAIVLHALDATLAARVRLVSGSQAADEFDEGLRAATRSWLETRAQAAGLPPERTEPVVAVGSATYEVIAAAERKGADLIVMGSRGAGSVGQRVIGSVARGVIRSAGCSVVVVTDHRQEESP